MKCLQLSTLFAAIFLVNSAPSSPASQAVYDQKQTGEHNIQVHLKDIQIIALLGDDALGDYDYNYDYSDFTIKPPVATNVTLKPEEPPSSSSPSSPTQKPEIQSTTQKIESTTKVEPEKATSTEKVESVPFNTSSPDRIKVQIIEEPSPDSAIVPTDDLGLVNATPLGEVLHYRRCATGYARDKKGRCRRVRRPSHQHQFDISRLASNIAARFRGSSSEEASLGDFKALKV